MEEDNGWVAILAASIGSSENALRLFISILAGYPLAFVYRGCVYGRTPTIQHAFFILCGLGISFFNFGGDTIHSVLNILLNYVILLVSGGTSLSVYLAFTVNTVYLCTDYFIYRHQMEAIKWTAAQCVLTLRLTGLVLDVYDGHQSVETLSPDQKKTRLTKIPSLLEMAAHSYFFGGFLIGPQFPMTRYQNLVKGAYSDPNTGGLPKSIQAGFLRFLPGALYTTLFQISSMIISNNDLTSEWFAGLPFLGKYLIIIFWGKLFLYKYIGSWLITEGACIITGLPYNGKDKSGKSLWDACANIHIIDFELGCNFEQMVGSFHVSTNRWMGKYVFKRLKFLGSKQISHAVTMFYLAIWHGLVSGYMVTFVLEFFVITCEKELKNIVVRAGLDLNDFSPPLRVLCRILLKMYVLLTLGYALVPFGLHTYDKYAQVYIQTYLLVPAAFITWPIWCPFLKAVLPKSKAKNDKQDEIRKEE